MSVMLPPCGAVAPLTSAPIPPAWAALINTGRLPRSAPLRPLWLQPPQSRPLPSSSPRSLQQAYRGLLNPLRRRYHLQTFDKFNMFLYCIFCFTFYLDFQLFQDYILMLIQLPQKKFHISIQYLLFYNTYYLVYSKIQKSCI